MLVDLTLLTAFNIDDSHYFITIQERYTQFRHNIWHSRHEIWVICNIWHKCGASGAYHAPNNALLYGKLLMNDIVANVILKLKNRTIKRIDTH